MYAIIQTGGKQYRVSEGDTVRIERIPGEVGDSVQIGEVLMIGGEDTRIGTPRLDCQVQATITEQGLGAKIVVGKFKRRKMYRRKRGHRQHFTQVTIDSIGLTEKAEPAKEPAKKKAKEKPKQAKPKQDEKKAAKVQAKAKAPKKAPAKKEAKASKPEKKATQKGAAPKKKSAPKKKASRKKETKD